MSEQQKYTPLKKEEYLAIKAGDIIERMLGFCIPIYLGVDRIENGRIYAGFWEFDHETGLEIDEDLQDMRLPIKARMQISYIRRILTEEQKQLLKDGAKEVPFTQNKEK